MSFLGIHATLFHRKFIVTMQHFTAMSNEQRHSGAEWLAYLRSQKECCVSLCRGLCRKVQPRTTPCEDGLKPSHRLPAAAKGAKLSKSDLARGRKAHLLRQACVLELVAKVVVSSSCALPRPRGNQQAVRQPAHLEIQPPKIRSSYKHIIFVYPTPVKKRNNIKSPQ